MVIMSPPQVSEMSCPSEDKLVAYPRLQGMIVVGHSEHTGSPSMANVVSDASLSLRGIHKEDRRAVNHRIWMRSESFFDEHFWCGVRPIFFSGSAFLVPEAFFGVSTCQSILVRLIF